jgi:DNA-directed RNA polymerase subunit E'/Rpb7
MPTKTDIYYTRIQLKPNEIYNNLDDNIMKALKFKVLNKCINVGYITKIHNIARRSKGIIKSEIFNASPIYNIWYLADVIDYTEGDAIYGLKIDHINKYGIHMSKGEHINGYIESGNLPINYIEEYSKGDIINATVLGSVYNINSPKIEVLVNQLHYYNVESIKKYMINLYNRESLDTKKLNNISDNVSFINEDTISIPELGFDQKIIDIQTRIDKIETKKYEQYSRLSNPFQFIIDIINKTDKNIKGNNEIEKSIIKIISKIGIKDVLFLELYEILKNLDDFIIHDTISTLVIGSNNSEYINSMKYYYKNNGNKPTYDLEKNMNDSVINKYNKKGISFIIGNEIDIKGLLNLIVGSLQIQDITGTFICKIGNVYDIISAEIIYILSMFYKNIILFKPYINNLDTIEKYIIATDFIGIPKTILSVLDTVNKSVQKNKGNIETLFTKSILDDIFTKNLFSYNTDMLRYQYNKIDEIITLSELYPEKDKQINRYLECQKSIAYGYLENIDLI